MNEWAVAKQHYPPVMNAVGGEPGTSLEGHLGSRLLAYRRNHFLERQIVSSPQVWGQDPDQSPVIGAAHREEQVKSFAPEIDVELVRHHRTRDSRIGDEENMLVGRALECDRAQLTHGAARAVAACDPRDRDLLDRAVRLLERRLDVTGILREADQLRAPLHGHALLAEGVAQQPFVIVLPRIRRKGYGLRSRPMSPNGSQPPRRPCTPMLSPRTRLSSSSAPPTSPRHVYL